nr:MAG TPA: hypothetical protein [Caudoviricetes sp.]
MKKSMCFEKKGGLIIPINMCRPLHRGCGLKLPRR